MKNLLNHHYHILMKMNVNPLIRNSKSINYQKIKKKIISIYKSMTIIIILKKIPENLTNSHPLKHLQPN